MGEPEATEKAGAGPSDEKKPSSLRVRVERVRKSREQKFNFGKLVVAFVALAITGLVIWLIVQGG
ncbi:MAG: hypothetical protein ACYTKD_14145 [Planctomycetota bacterium]|jgi:cytoskeletal protein RodZ